MKNEVIIVILSLGFDSFLEKSYYLDEYKGFGDNQVTKQEYDLGGRSISCARILKALNLDVFIIGLLGGLNGNFIFNGLKDLDIHNDFVNIKDESPTYISVYKDEKFTFRLKETNPRITREEIESFYKLYEDLVYKYKYICALGEIPKGIPEAIYFDLTKIAKKNGRKLILDTRGKALELGLEAIPYMVKLRLDDLESLSKIKVKFEGEIIRLGQVYIEKGIEILVIDLDEKGSMVLTKDFAYRLELINNPESLNEDMGFFISGFAFGLIKNYDMDTIMKLGQAMRIAYGQVEDISSIDMSDVKKAMGDIEIRKINY